MSVTNGIPVWNSNPTQVIPKINTKWSGVQYLDSGGDSIYNALQVVLTKRITQGLQFQSSYTWSKLIDNNIAISNSDNTASSPIVSDPYDSRFDRGPAEYDLTNVWVLNGIYNLPSL